jgi:hypothetical protein
MKYLLTESQINKFINRIIQETINELQEECEDYDESLESGDWYNWRDCDYMESFEKLVINDIEKIESIPDFQTGSVYPTFRIWVNIYYSSISPSLDFIDLRGVLHYRIFQKYKMKLHIVIQEEINTNKNREW